MRLRLDANEAWNLEQAIAILDRCTRYAIEYVEQPLKAHDVQGMHTLRQAVSIPIAADEAVHSLSSARCLLEHRAADILIIKPQLAGGLRLGRQIIEEAAAYGVQSVVTSTLETGIGLVAALHLAAAVPTVTLACGLATGHLLADDLLLDELPIRSGFFAVPPGPGLGVQVDAMALNRYASREQPV
jgi:o-succinylbenzoate synthase